MRRIIEMAFFTPDVARMVEFYRTVLGQDVSGTEPGESAWFAVSGVKWFIHKTYAGYELPPFTHVAFNTPNLDRDCGDLRQAGLHIAYGPKTWPWGKSAYLRDPDGNWIELHEVPGG